MMIKSVINWSLIMLSLIVSIDGPAQERIPITISNEGHWLVKATVSTIDGNFILDTGAGITVLTQKFASKLKSISRQDGGYTGFRATGERLDLDLFTVDEIKVGNYARKSSTVAVVDANINGLDGLISLSDFRNQPFTIDYMSKTLTLESRKTLPERKRQGRSIPIQVENSRDKSISIFSYFTLNDRLKLQLMLDSGAENNAFKFNSRFMLALGIDSANHTQVSRTFKGSEFNPAIRSAIYKTTMDRLACTTQPIKKDTFSAWFVDGLIYDGVISLNWLGNRITIDCERSEIIVN